MHLATVARSVSRVPLTQFVCRPGSALPPLPRCAAAVSTRACSGVAAPSVGSRLPARSGAFDAVHVSPSWLDGFSAGSRDGGGVTAAAADDAAAAAAVADAVHQWRLDGRKSVWLPVPMQRGGVMAALEPLGFQFHHAQGSQAMLLAWLPDTPSLVPPFATHQVGVAGVCVDDDRGRVLVVKERGRGGTSHWKFPGGLADQGEHFGDTCVWRGLCWRLGVLPLCRRFSRRVPCGGSAERELFEETGCRSAFQSVLCFRHQHGRAFGVSDLYVMCRMRPQSFELSPCQQEILAAEWLSFDAFFATSTHAMNRMALRLAIGQPVAPVDEYVQAGGVLPAAAEPGAHELTAVEMKSVVHPDQSFLFYHAVGAVPGAKGQQ